MDAYRKRQELLEAREAAELRAKPLVSPGSQRLLRRNPSEGDVLTRLSSPVRSAAKYESPRRSDELETPKFDSFKAKPMPNYGKIHMMNSFENGCRIATLGGAGATPDDRRLGVPGGSQPGELHHLRRQLAAVRNRGLDESTQELVEGLLATIDAKTAGSESAGLQRPGRSRSPTSQSPRRSGTKRANRKMKQIRQQRSSQGVPRQARVASSRHRMNGGEGWETSDDSDDDAELFSGGDIREEEEEEPLTPRAAYASLSAEKAAATGRVSPSAPFPPIEMSEETAKIICHSAKFVALHGPRFFATLQSKHKGDPPDSPWGWISEPESSDSMFFFTQRLEYEQEMISQANSVQAGTEVDSDEPTAATSSSSSAAPAAPPPATTAPLQETLPRDSQSGVNSVGREPAAPNVAGLRQSIFGPAGPEATPWIRPLRTMPVHASCGLPWVHIGYVEKGQPVR